jgi:TRAP-type C4-dicarboxylate transport system substrate-binding protein
MAKKIKDPAPIATNLDTEQNLDAELLKEAIAQGETEGISVDLDADYEAAQSISTSTVTPKAAAELVAPERPVASPDDVKLTSISTSDSVDYAEMAKDVSPTTTSTGEVTDDLVAKALEMGQPG